MIDLLNIERALGNADGSEPVTLPAKELRMLLADYDLACAIYERWEGDKLIETSAHEQELSDQAGEYENEIEGLREQIAELKAEVRQLEEALAEDVMA